MHKIPVLRGVTLFACLPHNELEELANHLRQIEFLEDTLLMREGESSGDFYILLDGTVEIVKSAGTSHERVLAMRGSGSLLGEMSYFSSNKQHTASVRSLTRGQLLVMSHSEFDALLRRRPEMVYDLVSLLSNRLEHTENNTILELREKNLRLTQAYQELKEAQSRLIEQEKLKHELEIARQIQTSILPKTVPYPPGYEFGVLISPARAVGGDFYDFIPLPGKKLGIVVGDVSDKGVPAALYMSMVYSLVRAEARRRQSPELVLSAVNRQLEEIDVTRMYVTLIYGVLDLKRHTLTYARAGHPPPILFDQHAKRLHLEDAIGQPLGMLAKPQFDRQSVTIPPGGLILFFTDGIIEAADPNDQLFDLPLLQAVLQEGTNLSAQAICQEIFARLLAFTGDVPQQDDLTLMCIKHST